MIYRNLTSLNDTFKEKVLDVFFEIRDIITLNAYENNDKKCNYCFKVLCWLNDWDDDFYDYETDSDKNDYQVIKQKATQLYNYLRNHDIFGCDEDCQTWASEQLNKLVYVKLPKVIKEMNEDYLENFNK